MRTAEAGNLVVRTAGEALGEASLVGTKQRETVLRGVDFSGS